MYYEFLNRGDLPITLSEAKEHLRIDADLTADDGLISAYILGAVDWGQRYMNRDLSVNQWALHLYDSVSEVRIKRSPLIDIVSVGVFNGTDYDDYADYELKRSASYATIYFDSAMSNKSKIVFSAGYSTANLPANIKAGLFLHIAHLYENRGDVSVDIPPAIKHHYNPSKLLSGYA